MDRFHGKVGFVVTEEIKPGVFSPNFVERVYSGTLLSNYRRLDTNPDSVNDNVTINNKLSIIMDPFAYTNFHSIRYVEYMGCKWTVTNIEAIERPRLMLTLGGVYNGEQA